MRDAVGLIGKKITVKEKIYIIHDIHFLPNPTQLGNYVWFGLKHKDGILNYPYNDLLPYLKEQIKL
jgi:hypothetical protein